ncbi:MAG TPA: NUDIX hydrolase [Candidatus Saccharimonadales bacterium]
MKIVAKALITGKQGDILVLRRSATHPRFAHHFDFPGGEVEANESPALAVAREVKEETGLTIDPSELSLLFDKKVDDGLRHVLFIVELTVTPDISLSWEHDDYAWFTKSKLLTEPLPSGVDSYYADVIEWLGTYE